MSQYLDSAQRTIREGAPSTSTTQDGSATVITFSRTFVDGDDSFVMRAIVRVDANGHVYLATYMGGE